jgi:membrane protein DedA with SNARE-associated domain
MGRVKPAYFTMLNALGAAIWTIILFLIGYFFGHIFTRISRIHFTSQCH